MAKLTDEETALLRRLRAKEKEPDAPAVGRSFSIAVDLSDPEQIKEARLLGLGRLLDEEASNGEVETDDDDGGDEPIPRRPGYFDKG